jgi:hypothetical protein
MSLLLSYKHLMTTNLSLLAKCPYVATGTKQYHDLVFTVITIFIVTIYTTMSCM